MSEPSDFIARKVGPLFSQLAQDNNGVVTADHFNAIADRCIALTDGDPAKAQKIRSIMQNVSFCSLSLNCICIGYTRSIFSGR